MSTYKGYKQYKGNINNDEISQQKERNEQFCIIKFFCYKTCIIHFVTYHISNKHFDKWGKRHCLSTNALCSKNEISDCKVEEFDKTPR